MGLRRYCIAAFRAGQCPLWVRSGHHPLFSRCPLCPRKPTKGRHVGMSALCQKRTNALQQMTTYSITSSASNWIEFGTSMPSALAVRRLMTYSNLVVCNTGTDRSSPALDPSAGLPLIATVMVRRASYTSATECSLSLLRLNNLAVKMPSGMAQYWQDPGQANQKENCAARQHRNNDKTPDSHHQRIGYDGSNRGFDRPCGAHLFVQEHRKGNHRKRQRHHGEVEPDDGAIYDQRAAPPGCKHLVHKVRDRN